MAEQIMEGINPTRMDLLEIRKKLTLAEKGHMLLEEKRDALVERFFHIIDERNKLRKEIDELFKQAFLSLIQAEMIMGESRVEDTTDFIPSIGEVSFSQENIMGVKIPKIDIDKISFQDKPLYSIIDTCASLDEAQQKFIVILKKLLELVNLEGGIKNLAIEIEKTKRRVNVLENILIPKLKATQRYIEMQLEEIEREDFFRRKRIKAIMESRKQL